MKILLINNYFRPFAGAERVFLNQRELLKERGHEIVDFAMEDHGNLPSRYNSYFISNVDSAVRKNFWENFSNGLKSIHNSESTKKLTELIESEKPDIAHIHNVGRRISYSIIGVLRKHKIPIVHTLHDYKPVCSVNNFFRNDSICRKCLRHQYFYTFLYRCRGNSLSASIMDAAERYFLWLRGTYRKIDLLVAPSQFLKRIMETAAVGNKNIKYLPNFVDLPAEKRSRVTEDFILYSGRIDVGKGVETLIRAVSSTGIHLKIAGDGKLLEKLRKEKLSDVEFLGFQNKEALQKLLQNSKFVIVPSEWYENAPMAVLEAMSFSKPVIGSNIGGIPELIADKESGFLFEPCNVGDLREKILELYHDKKLIEKMGEESYRIVKEKFSKEKHYEQLMKVYNSLLTNR